MIEMARRTVNPAVQALLKTDIYFTDLLCKICNKFTPLRSLRTHYKVLEVSGNGFVWLGGWLALIWIIWNPNLFEMQVNFYIGLLVDIIAVATLKAFVRRRRPVANKDDDFFGTYGPDKYSFPSGHVSRVLYIACFFVYLYPLNAIFFPPLLAWSVAVSLTRILLRRHHILDVFAGIVLGIVECFFVSLIWVNKDIATWIVSYVSDEKLEGGEYHV